MAQGATIASCASAGQWRWCLRLLPSVVPGAMGNALMNAMAKARAWKASVSWLRMGSSPLGLSTMNAFTSAMLAAPEWARVMEPRDKREIQGQGDRMVRNLLENAKTVQWRLLFVAYFCKWVLFGE